MTNIASKLAGMAPPMPVTSPTSASIAHTAASVDPVGPDPATTATQAHVRAPTADQLTALVAHIQAKVSAFTPDLHFSVDLGSGKPVVMVTDQVTKEVVWQFPSTTAIQISKELDLVQKGFLLNRKV